MKKTIWIAREADGNSDYYKAFYDRDKAISEAEYLWDHLTTSEKKRNTVTVEGYEVEVPDGDKNDAESLFSDLLVEDEIGDPDYYQVIKEIKVAFIGGQSRYGDEAVNYMKAEYGNIELYAEEPIPEGISDDELSEFDFKSHKRLQEEIEQQAKEKGVPLHMLRFWLD